MKVDTASEVDVERVHLRPAEVGLSRIGHFGKLGLLAAAVAVAALLGWRLRGLSSQIALTAAAVAGDASCG